MSCDNRVNYDDIFRGFSKNCVKISSNNNWFTPKNLSCHNTLGINLTVFT